MAEVKLSVNRPLSGLDFPFAPAGNLVNKNMREVTLKPPKPRREYTDLRARYSAHLVYYPRDGQV